MPLFEDPVIQQLASTSLTAAGREPEARTRSGQGLFTLGTESSTDRRKLQETSWDFFNKIGEVAYVGDSVIGARIGQLTYYPAWREDGSPHPKHLTLDTVPDDVIHPDDKQILNRIVASLKTDIGGTQDFYSRIAVNLFVAGELYILGEPTDEPGVRKWRVVPVRDVDWRDDERTGERVYTVNSRALDDTGNEVFNDLPAGTVGIQIWKPHPNETNQPDAPLFHVLDILDELLWITRLVSSRLRQRIGLSGFLLIANSLAGPDFNPADTSSDMATRLRGFEAAMIKRAESNYRLDERGLPIAPSLPIVASVPHEILDNAIKHVPLENDINEWLLAEREAIIARFGSGISVPVELITGMGNLSHWNAWLIDKQLDMQHIDPLAQLIVTSISESYLRAEIDNLLDQGILKSDPEELRKVTIWFNRNTIINHPDQLEFFFKAFRLGIIGAGPILDVMGIDPETAITEADRDWLLLIEGVIRADEQSDDAPSRERTGNRTDSGIGPADESRRDDEGFSLILDSASAFASQRAGTRAFNQLQTDVSLQKLTEGIDDPSTLGRKINRTALEAAEIDVDRLFDGSTQLVRTWLRGNRQELNASQWELIERHFQDVFFGNNPEDTDDLVRKIGKLD